MHLITHKGRSRVEALLEARTEDALLQKYLYIPMGIAAGIAAARGNKRKASPARSSGDPPHRRSTPAKEEPRANLSDKERDEVEFTGWKAGGSRRTPDGRRMKCPYFNVARGCSSPKCSMVHTCYVCNGVHSMDACPKRPDKKKFQAGAPADDKAGKGAGKGKKGRKGKKA
jgi:hypothetical protein